MKQYTVLIADSSEDFCRALGSRFLPYCAVHTCCTGAQTLLTAAEVRPDVVVLDLMLPELDGIGVLEALGGLGCCPEILTTSCYVSPYILQTLQKLGVSCLLQKPCDLLKAAQTVRELLQKRELRSEADLFGRASELLLHLGFSPKLRGYAYLREAVLRISRQPEQSLVKQLYPSIANAFGVSAEDIEHSIRSAAADAWSRRTPGSWELFFPPGPDGVPVRPANAALILGLAGSLKPESRPAVQAGL